MGECIKTIIKQAIRRMYANEMSYLRATAITSPIYLCIQAFIYTFPMKAMGGRSIAENSFGDNK